MTTQVDERIIAGEVSLKAQRELVGISEIDKNAVPKDIPSDQALNVLSLKRCGGSNYFGGDIVGEKNTDSVLIALDVDGRRRVYVGDSNRLDLKLLDDGWIDDSSGCPCINHGRNHYWGRDREAFGAKLFLKHFIHRNGHINYGTDCLKVSYLARKRGHLNSYQIGSEVLRRIDIDNFFYEECVRPEFDIPLMYGVAGRIENTDNLFLFDKGILAPRRAEEFVLVGFVGDDFFIQYFHVHVPHLYSTTGTGKEQNSRFFRSECGSLT